MISGVHAVLYAEDAQRARAFFADVLGLGSVDAGAGWLIFALPPAELAVHPSEESGRQELYLMCDDLDATLKQLADRGVGAGPVRDEGWGLLSHVEVPGLGEMGIYQPRHASPLP